MILNNTFYWKRFIFIFRSRQDDLDYRVFDKEQQKLQSFNNLFFKYLSEYAK